MHDLLLIGAGGHGKACLEVAESTASFNVLGFIDAAHRENFCGYPVLGNDDYIYEAIKSGTHVSFLIAIGKINSAVRIKLFERITAAGGKLATLQASTAYVSGRSVIGAGSIVMHHAMVNSNAQVGVNVIINNKALIEHDSIIGAHTHISTGAIINGTCTIGERVYVGSNAVVSNNITIASDVIIGAGAVVIKDITEAGTFAGVPARKLYDAR